MTAARNTSTKAQLITELAASHEAYQHLLAKYDEAVARATPHARTPAVSSARAAYLARGNQPTAAQLAYTERCAAARERAMSSGQSTRV